MELKLQSPFSALVLAFLVSMFPGISFAQESELVPHEYHPIESHTAVTSNESLENNEELTIEDEKNSSRTQSNTFVVRGDSVGVKLPSNTSKSAKVKSGESQKSLTDQKSSEKNEDEEKENSILSFNFLYYIFEKFKLSDIVDE